MDWSTVFWIAQSSMSGRQMVILAVVAAVTTLMMVATARRRRDGMASPRTYVREQQSQLREQKAIHTDLEEIMDQLQKTTQEIGAQLDAKFIRLERVMAMADERIERLERLSERRGEARGRLDVTIDDDSAEADSVVAERAPSSRTRIEHLSAAGKSPAEIAQMTGVPIGEVELTLALERTRRRGMAVGAGK